MLMALLLAGSIGGCRDPGPGTATDRLWISELPTSPRKPITAFLVTRTHGARLAGAFFQGSAFRGEHDLFEWQPKAQGRATIRFFQDDEVTSVRFETCKPSHGFDHCIVLHGDPKGVERYQSRRRWVVRGPRRGALPTVTAALDELVPGDPELAQWTAATAEGTAE
jgi:hypothetical protein